MDPLAFSGLVTRASRNVMPARNELKRTLVDTALQLQVDEIKGKITELARSDSFDKEEMMLALEEISEHTTDAEEELQKNRDMSEDGEGSFIEDDRVEDDDEEDEE
jgi:hypothetical protein